MQYKVIEIGHDRQYHETERKELYRGPSASEAVKAYNQPQSLPFADKRFYQGTKRLYAYELYDLPKE